MNIIDATEKWLTNRGITPATQQRFNIHISEDDHSIVIPISSPEGEHLFNKYRRSPFASSSSGPKYRYDRGSKASLFGAQYISPASHVVIVEGELDAALLWSKNIPAVSSTGGAGTFKEEWVPLFENKQVFICYDNDEAGAQGSIRVLRLIPHARVILLPDITGVKDVTDYCERGGDFNELMRTAKEFSTRAEVEEDMRQRQSQWLSTLFHHAYLIDDDRRNHQLTIEKPTYTTSDRTDIERARAYPLKKLIKFSANKARCLWHEDSTPSLHYYEKNNTAYCFGCSKHADAIDIVRALYKCSFKDAIDKLT